MTKFLDTFDSKPGLDRRDNLLISDGLIASVNKKRIYAVRANGAVVAVSGTRKWFRRRASTGMVPGDTTIVPMDLDRMPGPVLWQTSTSSLSDMAIAVAAVANL